LINRSKEQTTRDIVLECAEALEKAKREDPAGTIDLLPYFQRVIKRTLEAAARIAESLDTERSRFGAYGCGCGKEIGRRIREKKM